MANKKYILGGDPGQKGYICLLKYNSKGLRPDDEHVLIKIPSMSDLTGGKNRKQIDEAALWGLLRPYGQDITHAWIEKQWGRPGRGAHFKLGDNYGKLKAAITACVDWQEPNSPFYHEVDPPTWQKNVRNKFDESGYDGKDLSIHVCELLFPKLKLPKGDKDNLGGRDDNAAESVLIAYYGWGQISSAL